MALSKNPLPYLDKAQGFAPTIQKESFSLMVYSMGVRTIEESLGVEGKFFNSRTVSFKLTDPECINAVLDLMEAISSVPRKRIRIMDLRGFKDAGHVLKGFHHISTHSKSVNMSALGPAMGRWVSMLCGHLLAGVKDIFRNGAPNCLVIVMICTGGRHWSVMCTELVNRLASVQGIECCAIHLCQSTWGRICSVCEHCSWSSAPRCELAKLRDQNLLNIILPNAKLNRSLKKWTEAERIAEVEAAAGSAKQPNGPRAHLQQLPSPPPQPSPKHTLFFSSRIRPRVGIPESQEASLASAG